MQCYCNVLCICLVLEYELHSMMATSVTCVVEMQLYVPFQVILLCLRHKTASAATTVNLDDHVFLNKLVDCNNKQKCIQLNSRLCTEHFTQQIYIT